MEPFLAGQLAFSFDIVAGTIGNSPQVVRRLGDLRGVFADNAEFEATLARENPVLYTVASVETFRGPGQLHYGLGTLMPGRIGAEYYCTKGHLHAWRPAAEVYIGLAGEGVMLLEDEQTGETRMEPLGAGRIVYVPGSTAHRTCNTGDVPLVYLGVYDAAAGHDYGAIAKRNFRSVVIERDGRPTLLDRHDYLASVP